MKLIYCKECQDVVKLDWAKRECKCGHSGGHYKDNLNAMIWGSCVPLGILNASLRLAIVDRPDYGLGSRLTAFVIPKKCNTVERLY